MPKMPKSENKFFTFFNEASDGIVVMDHRGKITEINPSFCKLLGYSREELLRMSAEDLVDPAELKIDPIAYEPIIRGEKIIRERKLKRKDGEIIVVEVNNCKTSDDQLLTICRDLTELRLIRRKNAISESSFHSAFEHSAIGMTIVSTNGQFLQVNQQFVRMVGYSKNELLNMTCADITHPEDVDKDRHFMQEALAGRRTVDSAEKRYIRKNNEVIWINLTSSLVTDDENRILYFVNHVLDITNRIKSEEELLILNRAMKERVKELQCLYQLSELTNNPNSSIEDILSGLMDIIPPAYQYPEITTARVRLYNNLDKSANFIESEWKQEAAIRVNGKSVGSLEVFYIQQKPEIFEGPFLREERFLINSIAETLGSAIEHKNAQEKIIEQAKTFETMIENTKEAIYLLSPDFMLLQFNKTAQENVRVYRNMDLKIGMDFRQILYEDSLDIFYSMFEDALSGKHTRQEIRAQISTDDYHWFVSKMSPVYESKDKLIGVTIINEGIDESKLAELELLESEEKFRRLVEQSLSGVYIIQDGQLVYVNPGFEKIFGYTKAELLNKVNFEDMIHEDDLEKVRENYQSRISRESVPNQYNFRAIRKDGSIVHLEVISNIITYSNKLAVIGTLIDITDHVMDEIRINQAVVSAQEKERYHIGMELHDNVQQILLGSGMHLAHAIKQVDGQDSLKQILMDVKNYNTEAVRELRRLSHKLAPSVDTKSSLRSKIDWLLTGYGDLGKLSLSVEIGEFDPKLNNDIQLAFYRILQEQISNIMKYANASKVDITIQRENEIARLHIKDDGVGFNVKHKFRGIGLENIRRRVHYLQGKIEIKSAPKKGCEILVEVPIPKP